MAETTIEWCRRPKADGSGMIPGYTFNAHRGCSRVSEGCRFCFAATLSKRNPAVLGTWGPNGTRTVAAESYWKLPEKWDKQAAKAGERRIVFSADLGDVFEDWQGPMLNTDKVQVWQTWEHRYWVSGPKRPNPRCSPLTLGDVRQRLFRLIQDTPNLDWLVLTKRPENALRMMVEAGLYTAENPDLPCPQRNLWIGTSIENQEVADTRIPALLRVPAVVRFLSVEPLLGPVNLREHWYTTHNWHDWLTGETGIGRTSDNLSSHEQTGQKVDWVIVGGESGPGARPMRPEWACSLRDQCVAAGVPFFFKQWGSAIERGNAGADSYEAGRVGEKKGGRVLYGRTWDQFPATEVLCG